MIYPMLLAVGALGTLVMGLSGLRGGRSARVSRGRGRARGRARGKSRSKARGQTDSTSPLDVLIGLLSPLALFSLCMGAGAAGMITGHWWWAALGGIAFWKLVIEPLQELLLRFASEPATNLEGARATEATVQSRFNAAGQGMVSLTVDGQLRRVLAQLAEGDPSAIKIGEKVVVVEVDTKHNTCRVASL
nr:hypothetical protein [Armatimonas sp.]